LLHQGGLARGAGAHPFGDDLAGTPERVAIAPLDSEQGVVVEHTGEFQRAIGHGLSPLISGEGYHSTPIGAARYMTLAGGDFPIRSCEGQCPVFRQLFPLVRGRTLTKFWPSHMKKVRACRRLA
jgi:hypothetical protein